MPTYEYRCKECCEYIIYSASYEMIKELEPMKCPKCGKEMDRVYSCNFILKGSGWARDGYVTKGSLKDLDEDS